MRTVAGVLAISVLLSGAAAQAQTKAPAIADADTRAWWAATTVLSSDAFEGRDAGSPGHTRAAEYVAKRFAAAGLKPAGDNGGFIQSVPLREVRVESAGTSFTLLRDGAAPMSLAFLREIGVAADTGLPATVEGAVTFRGYCATADIDKTVAGQVVVCFNSRGKGAPSAAQRLAAITAAGGVAIINVDDARPAPEPARWPDAYSRSIQARDTPAPPPRSMPVMRLGVAGFARLVQGSSQDGAAILSAGMKDQPLPAFTIPGRFRATFQVSRREFASENVLGLLPGTDPTLSPEVVVLSAHLDGYGHGEPVDGDGLYNGAFDDAAYVATLIQLADRRKGQGFKRSVLFAAFTAEEKGLLGANWFTRHPTVAKENLAANINLDQLRPLFPLKMLTMLAMDQSSLTDSVLAVAKEKGLTIRPDPEPERNLLRRADHWPFLSMGVPATGFIFGYEPGTEAEARYREWYRTRYHRPQDDITQPIDFVAARDFNAFFYRLSEVVANSPTRPVMRPARATAP